MMDADSYKLLALTLLDALENEHKAYMNLINTLKKEGLIKIQPDKTIYNVFIQTAKKLLENEK